MGELYTIGHSTHQTAYFISLLKQFHIDYLLDVQSIPYSKYAEHFNRENIYSTLISEGIQYYFMGKYFGARPQTTALYDNDACLDFEKVRESPDFIAGIKNVCLGLCQGHNIALMCTEKNPINCHRAILVARAFALRKVYANHILSNGEIMTQLELDENLLQKYFPDRNQLTLFTAEREISEEKYVSEAYKLRNKEIGYHISF